MTLLYLEFICIFLGITTNYKDFSDQPYLYCNCNWCCCDKSTENQIIKDKKEEKIKRAQVLENKIKENRDYILEMDKNKENLQKILLEIKKINAEKEEINYKLYLERQHKMEYDIYLNIPNELKKLENILEKRLQELLKLKEIYDKNK